MPTLPVAAGDRRMGPRLPVEGVAVDLLFERPRSFGRRPKVSRERVQLVDVSIEGALLHGPQQPGLVAGARVVVESCPGRAVGEIRHVSPRPDGTAAYGVRVVAMDERVRRVLFDFLGRDRWDAHDAWLSAR